VFSPRSAAALGRSLVSPAATDESGPRRQSRDTSILHMPRSARERDRVAHVGKPGDVGERTLEAEAEAGVRYRAVAAQVAVPAVVLPVDSELRHPCIEHVEPLLA